MTNKTRRAVGIALGTAILATVLGTSPAAAHPDPNPVQTQLDLLTSVDRVPGALVQGRNSRGRLVTMTAGTAELGTDRPMVGKNGRFRVASVTKTFVATAVLQLVAKREVRLDEPIETYLPGVVRGTGDGAEIDGRDITVRQLLQHTSGLPNYTEYVDFTELDGPVEASELVRLALSNKPDFTPGDGWRYSNTGFLLAGMVVERVTGKDIGTAVAELVIRPAGLPDTYWPRAGERQIRGRHAHNYMLDKDNPEGPLVDVTEYEPSWAGASGALVSTPADLNKFWRELLDGHLLPSRQLAQMQTTVPAPGIAEDANYGLGLAQLPLSCGYAWGHGGDLAGAGVSNASVRTETGREATVYLTAQTGKQASNRMMQTIDTALCT
ncbi:serine hydrolase domain-containing protein [Actinophytocola sediminis]